MLKRHDVRVVVRTDQINLYGLSGTGNCNCVHENPLFQEERAKQFRRFSRPSAVRPSPPVPPRSLQAHGSTCRDQFGGLLTASTESHTIGANKKARTRHGARASERQSDQAPGLPSSASSRSPRKRCASQRHPPGLSRNRPHLHASRSLPHPHRTAYRLA